MKIIRYITIILIAGNIRKLIFNEFMYNFKLQGYLIISAISIFNTDLCRGNNILNYSCTSTIVSVGKNTTGLKNKGKLFFINSHGNDTIACISVEIAEDEIDREQGLMWRKKLIDTAGMIFIYDNERLLTFWMKNTYISLDIIFVNANKEIISIIENAIPNTETSLSSVKKSKYAIEVNAGYCKKYNVHINDVVLLRKY